MSGKLLAEIATIAAARGIPETETKVVQDAKPQPAPKP